MKILRVELVGYKRLLLNNIHRFEITPTSPYQLIIGTNGSGKSSVMEELTPLPAVPANYQKGGSKTIELEHRGINYFLKSDFKGPNHHSFLKNGLELNEGGTGQVQKVLVEKEFGLDSSLRDILIDETTFTKMSPQHRREWVTRLSGGDLDYAIRVFNKVKTRLRDTVGAIKHLKGRLVTESENLTDEKEVLEMQARSEMLKQELTAMMSAKDNRVKQSPGDIERKLDETLEFIAQSSKHILKSNLLPPDELEKRPEDFDAVLDIHASYKNELTVNDNMLKHFQNEYAEMSDIIEALNQSGATGADELKQKIKEGEAELSEIKQKIRQYFIEDEPGMALQSTRSALDGAVDVFVNIPDNSQHTFSRNALKASQETLDKLTKECDKFKNYRNRALERIEHIETAKETQCPKCSYVWIPGISENELVKLKQNIEKAAEQIESLSAEMKREQEFIEECNDYSDILARFKRYINEYPRLRPLWDTILEKEYLYNQPKSKAYIFDEWVNDVEYSVQYHELSCKVTEYRAAIEHIDSLGKGGTHYADRVAELIRNIEKHTARSVELKRIIDVVGTYVKRVKVFNESSVNVEQARDLVFELLDHLTSATRNQLLDQCIGQHQVSLAMLQSTLIERQSAKDIVKDIKVQHDRLADEAAHLKIVMDELSPTDGFIAEQLMGFIQSMVEEINFIISSIWTYDMEVLPCGFESEELDYKFPLKVKGSDLLAPDVSKGSSSQTDVVDFAFKLVVMLCLDLQDYPLYLDELAPSLDEQHRINIMSYVKQLVDGGRCSQMFMISHYHSGHGSFTSAQYCVMDDQNITTPVEYNKHVVME